MEPYRARLPIVTQEIGDTWVYGIASDPVKVARYREMARLRQEWLEQRRFRVGDSTDLALLRRLALCAEHTWGVDTKRLKDYQHYKPQDLQAARNLPEFRVAETSWAEKRKNIDDSIASLPEPWQAEAHHRLTRWSPSNRSAAASKSITRRLGNRNRSLGDRAGSPNRGHPKAASEKQRPRMGLCRSPAGFVQLPNLIQGGLRPL